MSRNFCNRLRLKAFSGFRKSRFNGVVKIFFSALSPNSKLFLWGCRFFYLSAAAGPETKLMISPSSMGRNNAFLDIDRRQIKFALREQFCRKTDKIEETIINVC
jgi:hypothetical protein